MRNPPKISIITPSFNQGRFIERTIKSVLGQGYENLEYIVVDGGSTDDTLDILKKYDKDLKWISEKDQGQSDAINKGIRISTGDIIAYLNSDDVYEAGALNKVAGYFEENPEVQWLTGRCRIIDEDDRERRRLITRYKNFFLARYSYNILLVVNFISQPATFLRREVIDELGPFALHHHRVMDYDYWLKAGGAGGGGGRFTPGIINEYLASFRVYRESKTSSSFKDTFREELEVASQYTDSRLLLGLHWLSYLGICAAYTALDLLGRVSRR
jgi:glycosyltransferase involved in cell wall biosynthesis